MLYTKRRDVENMEITEIVFSVLSIKNYQLILFHKLRYSFLAYRIRKSEVFAWDRNSHLAHVISPKKENNHMNSVYIGCIGRRATLSLG